MRRAVTALAAAALVASACGTTAGSSGDSEATPTTVVTTTTAPAATSTAPATTTTVPVTTTATATTRPRPSPPSTTQATTTTTTAPPGVRSPYSAGWAPSPGLGGGWPAYSAELGITVAAFGPFVKTSSDLASWTDPIEPLADVGGWFDGVIAVGAGFIGFGRTCEFGPCVQEAGLFTSTDGRTWSMVSRGEAFEPCFEFVDEPCHASVDWVGEGPDGSLLAYGYDGGGFAVWSSPTGTSWTRHDLDTPEVCCEPTLFSRALVGDRMIGAESLEIYDADCCPSGQVTHVYDSTDGFSWEVVDTGDRFSDVGIQAIGVLDGTLLMVGDRWKADVPTAWTTRDGTSWAEHDLPDLGSDRMQLFVVSDGFLVIGGSESTPYTMAFSPDGVTWSHLVTDPALELGVAEGIGYPPFRHSAIGPNGSILTEYWIWTPSAD